jgi:cobalt/nickel transport system permease protein
MHIPDNYLSPQTCAVMGAAMLPVWTLAVRKVKKEVSDRKLPLLGISAAFSFLVMMFNVPLPGGTTGHAIGATLVAILLGPWAATLSVSIALLIQAVLFGDGGILAFGANSFNMAFVIPFTGYFLYRLLTAIWKSPAAKYPVSFIAAYVSINIAAFCAAVEFGIQPMLFRDAAGLPIYCPYPLSVSIPAMLIPHLAVAGVLDGLITAGVLAYVGRIAPDAVAADAPEKPRLTPLYILIGVLAVFTPLGLIAKGTAWGEWAADEIKSVAGYVPAAMVKHSFKAPLTDYSVPFIRNVIAGYAASAILGIAALLIAFKLLSLVFRKPASTGEAKEISR